MSGTCEAGLYGNDTAATARPIIADGVTYTDDLTPTSASAWVIFRIGSSIPTRAEGSNCEVDSPRTAIKRQWEAQPCAC